MKKPWVLIAIGLPGSGKTTDLSRYAKQVDAVYVSPDDVRVKLTGDALIQVQNDLVWEQVYSEVAAALQAGKNVILDATMYVPDERSKMIKFCRDIRQNNVEIRGLYYNTPYEVCIERNKSRQRVVPDHAMLRMYTYFSKYPPSMREGFDAFQWACV